MSQPKKITIDDIHYYFSAVQKDHADAQNLGRRISKLASVRQKLLELPPEQFDLALQTIGNMVSSSPATGSETASEPKKAPSNGR